MNIQEEAHAMSGTVAEIAFLLPQAIPDKDVEVASAGTLREYGHGEVDMALQHEGIILLFELGARTARHGPGGVRGTEEVLSAGIAEVEAVRLDDRRVLHRSHIMRQGRAWTVCGYGLEAVSHISRYLLAV